MGDALRESQSAEELADATEAVLVVVLCTLGHQGFPDKQLNKDFVRGLAGNFKDKLEDLVAAQMADHAGEEEQKGQARKQALGEVLKRVLDGVFDELHAVLRSFTSGEKP